MSKLEGIFTPHMVPLCEDGSINEAELRRYVDWLIERGVHGLYPNGSTGEFTRFTPEERSRTIEIVCDQAAGLVPVLAGAAEANTRETIKACERYHQMGARAVAIVSPFYYKLSPESVYAFFYEIATNSPIDVTLYNIPMFASPIDVPTIARLAEDCPRVIGIKDSSGDLAFMMRMIEKVRAVRPDFTFLTGWEAVLVPMLLVGCDGGTNATSGVIPEITRSIYDLFRSGQLDDAMKLNYRILQLFDEMVYSIDFPFGVRAAVELRGIKMGPARQPLTPGQKQDYTKLQQVLQCIISDFGLVDPPQNGCPPQHLAGTLSEDRIAEISKDVVKRLREQGVVPERNSS